MSTKRQLKSLSTWGGAHPRLQPEVWPVLSPSFTVPAGSTIFTIGSCFARNVERNLATLKFDIPTLAMSLPEAEWPQGDNSFLNRYTPQTIWQDIRWTAEQIDTGGFQAEAAEKYAIELEDGQVIDTGFPGFTPVSRERFVERRHELFELNAKAFSADCVTITLGLIESWRDRETGVYLHSTPLGRTMMKMGERFEPEVTEYPDALRYVDEAVSAIRSRNPEVKILITTSPVALARTFTDDDIITANTYSKSVLRAVAGKVAGSHEATDYFPSYESAMLTRDWGIWDADLLHLSKSFIAKIVSHLVSYYFNDVDAAAVLHQKSYQRHLERDYDGAAEAILAAIEQNPDDIELLRHAATVEQARRNTDEAAALLEKVVETEPTVTNWILLGMARNRNRDREGAEEAYRKCLELAPENASARFQLSRLLMHRKAVDQAEQHLRIALEGMPRHWGAHLDYARIALQKGDFKVAIERAKAGMEHTPPKHRDQARYVIGKAHLELGEVETARGYAFVDGAEASRFLQPLREELSAIAAE